ncbi:DUF2256 domain-containing protein [Rhizobiales bacterium Sp-1]|uniref:DUF2256 domain-containing protein n=1 Tax=Segnochrobactrum spirostomi TaxID=2608987 RepID=A0A6A7Y024_9HYPH|nr:DUF2256 domain-containing protein [Segnochrobactrum spirostomi]
MGRKSELPQKICVVCGRPFAWRRKWARDWERVLYCSDRCRTAGRRSGRGHGDATAPLHDALPHDALPQDALPHDTAAPSGAVERAATRRHTPNRAPRPGGAPRR